MAEIKLRIMGEEHQRRQSVERPYQLICLPTFQNQWAIVCDSEESLGHLGDFPTFTELKEIANIHDHPTLARFFKSWDNPKPSSDFLADYFFQYHDEMNLAYFRSSFI